MSNTAAYNANEVAAVYMSLDRRHLLSNDEGGNKLGDDISLQNGFYGLSDPLNMRGVLESFEANFERGKGSSTYKIRILNPTTELEDILMGFYDNVFPSNTSVYKSFKHESDRQRRMLAVSGSTGDKDTAFLKVNEVPQLPRVYLRFGYGTTSRQGLSRIHKAVITDLKYIVSDKKDKVIELACVDLYTFNKLNPSFNKRPYISRVSVLDKVDGELSLRPPSAILAELFAKYTSAYPGCIPIVDLGAYVDKIDNLTYSVAFAMAEGDAISQKEAEATEEEPQERDDTTVTPLTEEQIKLVKKALNQPLTSKKALDREVKGVVTQQILFQAYKMMFEQIGLSWEIQEMEETGSVTGPPAQNQTNATQQPTQMSDYQAASQKRESTANALKSDLPVNLQTDLLRAGFTSQLTTLGNRSGTKALSFWPMGYRASGEPSISVDASGNSITTYGPPNPTIRPLTTVEKTNLLASNFAPLWVDAGMINPANYIVNSYVNEDSSFKYQFTVGDLVSKGQLPTDIGMNNPAGAWAGKPMPVSIPVITVDNPDTFLSVGAQNNTDEITIPYNIPLIDLDKGDDLVRIPEYDKLPEGEFRTWGHYASGTLLAAGEPGIPDALIPSIADNPPLLNLEPTYATVQWLAHAATAYQVEIDEQNAENEQEQQKELEEGNVADNTTESPSEVITLENTEEWDTEVKDMFNAYVYMGDSNESPHISVFFEKILNNLNRVIIGNDSKLMIQSLPVNTLSSEDRETLSRTVPALEGYDWEDDWVQKDSVLLIVGTESDITSQYGDPIVREIFSFPQIKQEKVQDSGVTSDAAMEFENQILWLDYGTPDSIIAKLDFEGDSRVLINLAQSNFTARQFNDIKKLFDPKDLSKSMITNILSIGLQNKISTILAESKAAGDSDETQREKIAGAVRLSNLVKESVQSSNALIDKELLEIFPEMVGTFEDKVLDQIAGKKSAKDMRVLASLVSNPHTLNWLFPEAQIDGATNKQKTQSIIVTAGGVKKVEFEEPIMERKVDFSQMYSRINEMQEQFKLTDVKHNYIAAMQQESFNIKLTTLGLPEIDNPAQEFLSRYVFLKFYDPRLANGSLHWLSGVYKMSGFRHVINPSQGFLTQLSLYKLPGSAGDIQTARDTR